MPYISPELRETVYSFPIESGRDQDLDKIAQLIKFLRTEPECQANLDGILNYLVTRIVCGALKPAGGEKAWTYKNIARVVAVFECAKQEFYDRVARHKENQAIINNGDIKEY